MKWIVKIANEEFFKKGVVYGREIEVSNMGSRELLVRKTMHIYSKRGKTRFFPND